MAAHNQVGSDIYPALGPIPVSVPSGPGWGKHMSSLPTVLSQPLSLKAQGFLHQEGGILHFIPTWAFVWYEFIHLFEIM